MMGGVVSGNDFLAIILAPILLFLLWLFLKRTRMGMAIRGVEQNLDFSKLVGINVSATYQITFGLGASMAAIAGILLGAKSFMSPDMGGDTLLKAFVVVVLGGLGNIPGTIGAAYIVGLLEASSMHFFGMYWTQAVLFFVMILVLIVRPTGIFGER
ncbi:MAG: branched-chain amino acid ABC transporter permease [Deltaproteobacteria bacterium]|nr:branched-chain amino acid ABC transporter permease [Deltaproteobacteria bacterium]